MSGTRLKFVLFLSVVLLVLFSCKKDGITYTIHGQLENIKDSIFFAARESGDSLHIDTIRVDNKGKFSFSGYVDTLTVVSLYFKDAAGSPYVLVDKGWNVEVKGDINTPDLILAKGGNVNDDLTKFKTENLELIKTRTNILDNDEHLADHPDSLLSSTATLELKNVSFSLLNVATEYVKNNPTKIASVMLINNFFKNEESLERLTETLDYLRGEAYDFPMAMQLREYKDRIKKSAVDSYAPAFKLNDIDGKEKTLNEFRKKYVLLIFESTICDLCTEMRPQIIKEYDAIKKDKLDVEFVSIIKDIEESPISKELKKESKWILLPDMGGWSSKVFDDYNIKEIPYGILISREGKILERDVDFHHIRNTLESLPNIKGISKK